MEAAFLRAHTDVAGIEEVTRTCKLVLGAVGMGQVRGQATLDVDGEHPNNGRGWRGRRGLVDRESRFGHFEGWVVVEVVCCFFLARVSPLGRTPGRRHEAPTGGIGVRATLGLRVGEPLGFGRASAAGAVSDELKAFRGRGHSSRGAAHGSTRVVRGACRL